ncbi:ABC transporter substrate-binding protein [Aquisalimonas lutea]|uniref:ABC transporter substrate-binding protein n=1 Tax=Aquisalimonas lutea TaxID=1327750 RepID=UPI0025B2D79D|nr:ABC transporter substrate-binding protein [Aquisalimonas lutea]MDN3516262.1 ABC transporter substrate-binding protein [Aquisalimonas lutea]
MSTNLQRAACSVTALALGLVAASAAHAQDDMTMEERMEIAERIVDEHLQPSVLSREEQLEEMRWFIEATEPYRGMDITVVSEPITTHQWESEVLAEAFSEMTGVNLTHDLIGEGDVVENLQTEMQTGRGIYDAYISDADLIGTHVRYDTVYPIEDYMNDNPDLVLPTLDLDDFINLNAARSPDGKLYQMPDQQFANLYWFRYDWFQREDLREQFQEIYGYELGVPVNWSAYEDIAEFFTEHVGEIDGERVYGHMDYGRRDPSLAWRFTDAWISMAGGGDTGLPNGRPVDEWGIRMDEDGHPKGASMSRGGATNAPAAVYSLEKFIEWLENYAPPEASGMTFSEAGPVPAQGQIAQQIFWYTAFTASMTDPELPVTDDEGNPKWRMAPSPHGPYWEEGMKVGYQDIGSWLLLNHTEEDARAAAWLYAQFTVSKSVDTAKSHEGLTFIRDSTIHHESFTERSEALGGLIEFYRSPARELWTDTGFNVPDYPRMTQMWWQNISDAVSGNVSAQEAMDNLATEMDELMARLERAGAQDSYPVRLNEERDPQYWLDQPGAPKPELDNEKPQGETVSYDELIEGWQNESN